MPPRVPALRLVHTGCAGLRLELPDLTVAIDPASDPGPVDLILLTWNERERLRGTREAVRAGRRPRVAAQPAILDWLAAQGALEALDLAGAPAGLAIEARSYQPVPYATPAEGLRKLRSAVLDPVRALDRLAARTRLPSCPPVALRLTLPDGRSLVHLNCALHRWTPARWLEETAEAWADAEWVLASWDYDEGPPFEERIVAFSGRHLVLTDLVGEVRRDLGLPVETRSMLMDRLSDRGLAVRMLAAHTSLRFGEPPTL